MSFYYLNELTTSLTELMLIKVFRLLVARDYFKRSFHLRMRNGTFENVRPTFFTNNLLNLPVVECMETGIFTLKSISKQDWCGGIDNST